MRDVADPLAAFRTDIVEEVLADGSDSVLFLVIGLVMVSGSHVEINLDIGHELHPEARGETGVSIGDHRSGETVD